jgi:serine/threonine-protein kinase
MSLTRKRYDPRHAPHQDYLKGKYLQSKLTQAELGKSIAHFEAAIGQDRRYALAYTGLAETYILFARLGLLCGEEARERAAVNISTALEIDSDLAEAHALGGRIRHLFAADSAAAESAYIRALELSPEYVEGYVWYAELLTAAGRHAEAGHKMQRAQELAPLSVAVHADAAWICYMTRKFEDCANQAWQALVLEARFAPAQHALGLAYEQMGEGEEAITELQNAHQCSENNVAVLAGLGHACARHGRPAEAEAISSKLDDLSREQRVSPYWRAVLHTGLGDFGAALSSLEEARQENDPWLTWLGLEPRFDSLRASAAFEQFLGRTGNRGGIALSAPNCAGY